MLPDTTAPWLWTVIAAPQAVLWLGIVVVLAAAAARGPGPRSARRVAVASAGLCGVAVSAFVGLLVAAPAWYTDWIGRLLMLCVGLCFLAALNGLIWSRSPPKSPAERRLALGIAAGVALVMVAEWAGR